MAQFSVHLNPSPGTRAAIPFLLDIQADVLSSLATRVVVPLYRLDGDGPPPLTRLTPRLRFQDRDLVAMMPELAGVQRHSLGQAVGDLASCRGEILAALDLLVTGF
jgi:toxin CcdB